jgi:hypothetical protein
MADIGQIVADGVNNLMELVSGETEQICRETKGYSVAGWRDLQTAKAAAVGGGAAVIPIAGYLTLPADLAATLRIMHRAATGIAYLKLGRANDETFAGILALWSGAAMLDDELAEKVRAASATLTSGQAEVDLSIAALTQAAGTIADGRLSPQVSQKVTGKIAGKLAANVTTRWIPIISALAGGGTNWWVLSGICEASEKYADFILDHAGPAADLPKKVKAGGKAKG